MGMNYQFTESEWCVILKAYSNHQVEFAPITRSNIKNTLDSIKTNRTINSTEQADQIIALLLAGKENNPKESSKEIEQENISGKEIQTDKIVVLDINQIIEQLRLFVKRIYENNQIHNYYKDRG